jgi:hypothetical protein
MLAQLRSTMCDASFHGFDLARYSYGIVLYMLEDGALTWADAEPRRPPLLGHAEVSTERVPHVRLVRAASMLVSAGANTSRHAGSRRSGQNIQNSGPKSCIYFNNVCALPGLITTLTECCGSMCPASAGQPAVPNSE